MTVSREEISQAAQARRDWAIESLSEFVRQPTVLGNEECGQRVAAKLFSELDMEVKIEKIVLDEIKDKPGFGPTDWQLEGKHNVVGIHEGGNGRSLIFNGHVDVVSPEPIKLWTNPPYEARVVEDEQDGETWMYGRGAGDMKGGTISYLWALHVLRDLGYAPAGKVICQSVVEEECTGNGALSLLEKGYRADAAIIPEPFNESITSAQVGVLWFRVRVLGMTTHVLGASRGVNAIEKSWPIIQALRDLEEEVNRPENIPKLYHGVDHPINLNVGTINGGDWQSTVAGECVTGFRFGAFPGESLNQVMQTIETRVKQAAQSAPWLKDNPPEIEWAGFRAEGCTFDVESEVGKTLRNAHKQWRGAEPEQLRCTATTDIRFFNLYYDIPATCYGPKARRIHGVDEKVSIDSMQRITEVMCSFIQDWCGLNKR
ncbi:MAG: ArgE/DapE family deacylase [Planctomycetes bacterium]|nr:ArgE/DapE family deacylase [Planctomycetota bacterium]